MRRRALREFAGFTEARVRTTRLFRQVVSGLERLGERWKLTEDDIERLSLRELASWLPFAPPEPDFARVRLTAPGGLEGFLVVHRAVLEN